MRLTPAFPRPGGMALLVALAAPAIVSAQATEYQVRLGLIDDLGPRAMGMGGAFTGLADDASAGLTNPAGLATLPKAMDASLGLDCRTRTGPARTCLFPSWFGGGLRPFRDFGFGLGFIGVRQSQVRSLPTGSLRLRLDDPFPLSVAVRPRGGAFALGVTRRFTHLSACGNGDCVGVKNLRSSKAQTWRVGALLLPSPQLRLGFVYQQAQRFEVAGELAGLHAHVRTPQVLSLGLSWRADLADSSRILVSSQTDLLRDRAPGATRRASEAEWRVGAEVTRPFNCYAGCGSMWQLRAGLHYEAALPAASLLGAPGPRGEAHLAWSAGASLALQTKVSGRLRLDVGVARAQRGVALLLGLNFRYPESYRSDLRYRRERDDERGGKEGQP